jgi:beta-lactamase regulating signal transducer with metallopeptidase domain
MSDFAATLLPELGRATLALTLAAGLAWLVLRFTGLQSPRLHRALWLLVLLVGWTLGGVPVAIPWHRTEPAPAPYSAIVASVPAIAPSEPVELNAQAAPSRTPAFDSSPLELADPAAAAPVPFAAPATVAAPPAPQAAPIERMGMVASLAALPWPLLIATLWLAGIGALVAVWLFGYARFVRAVSHGDAGRGHLADESWHEQWRRLLEQHGVVRPIVMRITDDTGPLLCRLPRGYELLIPAKLWQSLSVAERQSVLQHELAHYQRGDLGKSLAVRLLALPHWFNPCAWLAVRRFDEAAEWACDQAAAAPSEVTSYARALVRLGEAHLATRYGSAAGSRPLASRVRRLLKFQQKDSTMKTGLIVAAALSLAALAVVRVQLVAREPEAVAESSSEPTILTIEVSKDQGQPTVEPYLNLLQEEQPKPAPQPAAKEDELLPSAEARAEELNSLRLEGSDAVEEVTEAPAGEPARQAPKAVSRASHKAAEAAREAYQAALKSYEAQQMPLEEVCNWSKRWMTVATAAATDSPHRVKAAEQHLERMKSLQQRIVKLHELGSRGGDHQQFTAINFYVAEAEGQVVYEQATVETATPLVVSGETVITEEIVEQLPDGQEVRRKLPRVIRMTPNPKGSMPRLEISTPATTRLDQQPTPSARVSAPAAPTAIPNASQPVIAAPRAVPAAAPQLAVPSEAPARAARALEPPRAVSAAAPTEAVPAKAPPKAARRSDAEPSGQPTPRYRVALPEATFLGPTEADPRSRLRYDGKSFGQWKEELANELSTAKRTQAVGALRAFGNNGYGKEAAETIMELMGSYTMPASAPWMKSDELSTAALNAMGGLPREAALPVVLAGLKSDKVNQRLFAVRALPMVCRNPDEWKTLVVPYLNAAEPEVRASAVEALGRLRATPPETVNAVRVALADVAPEVVHAGFRVISAPPSLGTMGVAPRPNAVWSEALVSALGREEEWIRKLAAERLLSIGVKALPDLDKVAAIADANTSQIAKTLAEKIRADADKIIAASNANVGNFSPGDWEQQMRDFGEYAIPNLEKAAAESKNPAFVDRVKKVVAEIRKQASDAPMP